MARLKIDPDVQFIKELRLLGVNPSKNVINVQHAAWSALCLQKKIHFHARR